MKYMQSLMNFLISLILSVLITALIILNILTPVFSQDEWMANLEKTNLYEDNAQKLKLGIESLSAASGIPSDILSKFITPELIKKSAEQELANSFDYVTGKTDTIDVVDSSGFEALLIEKIEDYSKAIMVKIDSDTQKSIDTFIDYCGEMLKIYSEPFVFFKNILPILRTFYYYKIKLPLYLLIGIVAFSIILVLLNRKRLTDSIIFFCYGTSASGLFVFAVYTFIKILTAGGTSIFETPVIKLLITQITGRLLIYGIIIFILSQLILLSVFLYRRYMSKFKH